MVSISNYKKQLNQLNLERYKASAAIYEILDKRSINPVSDGIIIWRSASNKPTNC